MILKEIKLLLSIFLTMIISLIVAAILTLLVHELGHLVILKNVYKIKDAGIGIGSVKDPIIRKFNLFNTTIYITGKSKRKVRFFNGFVYPWREVHERGKYKRILFYASGFLVETLISILMLVLLYLFLSKLHFLMSIFLCILIFFPATSPLLIVLLALFKKTKTNLSFSATEVLKVKYGYNDGYGILRESKVIFLITLGFSIFILIATLIALYRIVNNPHFIEMLLQHLNR